MTGVDQDSNKKSSVENETNKKKGVPSIVIVTSIVYLLFAVINLNNILHEFEPVAIIISFILVSVVFGLFRRSELAYIASIIITVIIIVIFISITLSSFSMGAFVLLFGGLLYGLTRPQVKDYYKKLKNSD